ncbi:YsnF/AvaK domain-containing protein [Bacillus songklensis]|uniref:YsnF/AvaK domain-containing protein n=1 Tax=Bacillus songklensis TaxID=1069116 RepID=A0ABV8BA50_9BACI
MAEKLEFSQERTLTSKGMVTGAIIGGVLGAAASLLNQPTGILFIPGIGAITATVAGVLIGGTLGGIIGFYLLQRKAAGHDSYGNTGKISEHVISGADHDVKLQLRKEQLDISKKWVQTGAVTMHKEVVTEEKTIVVPVTHEELVIEKKVLDAENPDDKSEHAETIRIPISEERIEVVKHPTALEDVAIYKRQFQQTEHVEETLKKEKVRVETIGNAKIIDKEAEKHS